MIRCILPLIAITILLLSGCTAEQVERANAAVQSAQAAMAQADARLEQARVALDKAGVIAAAARDAVTLAQQIAEQTRSDAAKAAVEKAQGAAAQAVAMVDAARTGVATLQSVSDQAHATLDQCAAAAKAAKDAQAAGGATIDVILAAIGALIPGAAGVVAMVGKVRQLTTAVRLTAAHADRVESIDPMNVREMQTAKGLAEAEQVAAGVHGLIQGIRSQSDAAKA